MAEGIQSRVIPFPQIEEEIPPRWYENDWFLTASVVGTFILALLEHEYGPSINQYVQAISGLGLSAAAVQCDRHSTQRFFETVEEARRSGLGVEFHEANIFLANTQTAREFKTNKKVWLTDALSVAFSGLGWFIAIPHAFSRTLFAINNNRKTSRIERAIEIQAEITNQ